MTLIFVREKHDLELAHNRIETGIRKRKGGGVSGLKLDHFVRAEFSASDFKHWRVEIRGDQLCLLRQQIPHPARDDAGSRSEF
jgi:hypothetical protein